MAAAEYPVAALDIGDAELPVGSKSASASGAAG